VHLSLRGDVDASLPTFYVRIGQAIHGLEDSFTHAYRTPDGMAITVALNWVDKANGTHDEARDGPAHASKMDVCDDPDELRARNRRLATEASAALLRAALDTRQTRGEKMATVEGILDRYVGYSPGCTFGNGWCNAPEALYVDPGSTVLGCSSGGAGLLAVLGALLAFGFTRRRRPRTASAAVVLLAAAAALTAGAARAEDPPAVEAAPKAEVAADPHVPPPPTTVPVPEPGPEDPSQMAWGGYLGLSGSVDKPAAAIQLGVRLRLSTHWTVGWDVEANPWISTTGETLVRAGTLNTFGTVILRFPLAYENFNLRTTVNLGISYLLIDLYGAPKGSVGLYAAIYPLGLEWKLSRVFLLIINPLGIAVPMPQLKGIPFTYPQYRFSIGLGILAG
jgi:MYXO-CTERM domain-containing protein